MLHLHSHQNSGFVDKAPLVLVSPPTPSGSAVNKSTVANWGEPSRLKADRSQLKLDLLTSCGNSSSKGPGELISGMFCSRCGEGFQVNDKIVQSGTDQWHPRCFVPQTVNPQCGQCDQTVTHQHDMFIHNGRSWHRECFVCAQCFRQFPDDVFYEFDGYKFCEHDFHVLFAPCCGKCGEFIIGRVIKAMNSSWHPGCFKCQLCEKVLADEGFVKNLGRSLCRECNARERAEGSGKYLCHKCHGCIEEGYQIKFKSEFYHPYHFACNSCSAELSSDAREKDGELYCLRCHDKMGIPICGACRRPIEERVVHALGKTWHVEHFVCSRCEKPFLGSRHYEKKGLAFCELHYQQMFGMLCYCCNQVIAGETVHALSKAWCVDHFACTCCNKKMSQKTKFFEVDLKPVCKNCHDKFPQEMRKRLAKMHKSEI